MIYTDKKTQRLFIQFCFQGNTYKKRLPANMTRKEADKVETKLKNDLFFEANGIEIKKDILFEDFLTEYFMPFALRHYSSEGYKNVKVICKALLPFLKGQGLRKIRANCIEKFKSHRQNLKTKHKTTRKPATVIRELGIVSKIFSFAIKNEFLEFNPCSRVERPVFDNLMDSVLSHAEEVLLMKELKSTWARGLVTLILNTGLRQNDALNLSRFNVDFESNTIRLLQGKTGRRVEIPMNETVIQLLKAQKSGELFFPSPRTGKAGASLKRTLERASVRARIQKVGTRLLRRTFATRLDELNFSSSVKAKLLGHSDLRSVTRYERGTEILREAVSSLENSNRAKFLPSTATSNIKLVVNGGKV